MERFEITREMMKTANTYMPLSVKCEVAKSIAKKCITSLDTAEQNIEGRSLITMPEIKGEDVGKRMILSLYTLLGYYFNVEVPTEDENGHKYNDWELYDHYASSHIANQLERYKADSELRNIAFDIVADYSEFKKIVNAEIHKIIDNNNDIVGRLSSAITILSTPENIKELVESLKSESEEYIKLVEDKKKG